MFTLRRTARKGVEDAVLAERARLAEQHRKAIERRRAETATATATLIEKISTDYYAASALCRTSSIPEQTGVLTGCIKALAHITGLDEIVLGYRMDHALPIHGAGKDWICVVDTIDGRDVPVILGEGESRTPVHERRTRLEHAALVSTGHPLAAYYAERFLTTDQEIPA